MSPITGGVYWFSAVHSGRCRFSYFRAKGNNAALPLLLLVMWHQFRKCLCITAQTAWLNAKVPFLLLLPTVLHKIYTNEEKKTKTTKIHTASINLLKNIRYAHKVSLSAHLKRRNVRIHSPALSSASLFFISPAEDCWSFSGRTRTKLAGLLWSKLSCCIAGCLASVPTVVLGVSVDGGSSTRWDTSQLLHAWSFPSTDLHLDEEAEN